MMSPLRCDQFRSAEASWITYADGFEPEVWGFTGDSLAKNNA